MAVKECGHKLWYIPDGYIPPESSGTLTSHESICVLNVNEAAAHLQITAFFEDRDPIERISVTVDGRRTKHIRTASLERAGEKIPVGVPYALEVESDIPIVVQYSRLDSTQPANALMTTVAFPVPARQ